MTIAFVGGTGVSTTGAAKGTTSTTVAYNNVAAGRLAVLTVGAKPNTATITTPTGFTKVGEQQGGTGTNAADTGQTKTATYYRVLDGSETGNITVAATGGSVQGALDVYSKTLGSWDASQFVVASDATHGTNHSAASGIWADRNGVNAGDWLHVSHSGDTDDAATATSAPTIVQTGTTFGTVTGRSQVRNTSGNQGMSYSWSAAATAANDVQAAVTTGFTWSVSSCGPDLTTRLREYDSFAALVDTFSSTLDASLWATGGTASAGSGVATITISGYSYIQSVRNYSIVNAAVLLHTTHFPTAGSGYYAGMRIGPRGNGGSNFIGIYYGNGATISFEQTGTTAVEVALDTTAHAWIRIRHDGTNILLETSPDGATWTIGRTILAASFPTWAAATGLEVIMEGDSGDSWSFDDFNNASAPEVHTTSGTASTTAAATATDASVRTAAGTASTTAGASATRSTTRTVARTAPVTVAAMAVQATVRTTSGTASTAVTATAVAGAVKTTARTASATLSASATRATARTTVGTASISATATAARAGVHVTTGTASASASASAVAAGVRPTARTATVATSATAVRTTVRVTARSAAALATATAVRSGVHVTEGTAALFAGATTIVEGQEEHTSSGTATVHPSATALRSTSRVTARTASTTASASASAARSTTRVTAGGGALSVTATAVSQAVETHSTSGTAVVHPGASATSTGAHIVARVAQVTTTAAATRSTTRTTSGTAGVTAGASAVIGGASQSGHRRLVDAGRQLVVDRPDRQSRIVDHGRPRRRAD